MWWHRGFDLRWWLLSNISDVPHLQGLYAASVTLLFAAFLCFGLWPFLSGRPHRAKSPAKLDRFLLSDRLFVIVLALFIIVGRWPGLLSPGLNPDESQFIAGAVKLLKDPVFWRGMDGMTSGPLNIYPLAIPALFGLKLEYAGARLIGLSLVLTAALSLYFALRRLYGPGTARLAVLPVTSCFAFMTYSDYVHYSSEHVSIALLGIALFLLCRYYSGGREERQTTAAWLGVVLGLTPYAKLQALPASLAMVAVFGHMAWVKNQGTNRATGESAAFLAGLLAFSALVAIHLSVFSLQHDFWVGYITSNVSYTKPPDGFFETLWTWPRYTRRIWDTQIFFGLTKAVLALEILLLVMLRSRLSFLGSSRPGGRLSPLFLMIGRDSRRPPDPDPLFYYSLVILTGAFFSVVTPARNFPHYLLFLIVPGGFLIGVFLGEIRRIPRLGAGRDLIWRRTLASAVTTMILAGGLLQTYRGLKNDNAYLVQSRNFAAGYISPAGKAILRHAPAGGSMVVWGWAAELYVQTGLVQATRDGNVFRQVSDSPQQRYFLDRFVGDFSRSGADLFVDAVAPGFFGLYNRKVWGHETFPEVAAVVRDRYRLVEELQGVRIYMRR